MSAHKMYMLITTKPLMGTTLKWTIPKCKVFVFLSLRAMQIAADLRLTFRHRDPKHYGTRTILVSICPIDKSNTQ